MQEALARLKDGNPQQAVGDSASTEFLPSNEELYHWICRNETPPESRGFQPGQISSCRARWHDLKSFSERNALLEKEFDGDSKQNFHGRFWELCLPKAFADAGISLSRGAMGQPDFYFSNGGQKIWIEATVCGEPEEEKNKVPPPSEDFFGNLDGSYISQTMRALSQAADSKIEKFKGSYKKFLKDGASCVIALNGWRALNGHPDFPTFTSWGLSTYAYPMIVRTLYGMTEYYLQKDPKTLTTTGVKYERAEKTKPLLPGEGGAPIAHFLKPENREIAGVLYSGISIFDTNLDAPQHEFIFIQNPHHQRSQEISRVFRPVLRYGNSYKHSLPQKQESGHDG